MAKSSKNSEEVSEEVQEETQPTDSDEGEGAEDRTGDAPLSDQELRQLCQEQVCPECPEKEEMDNKILQVRAEADNYRKRMAREKEQHCKYAIEKVLEDLLPVVDNLELAAEHGRKNEACKDLVEGVDMTIKLFMDNLRKHGLEPVEIVQGQEFDPAWHEAMAEEERQDLEAGQVCQVWQKGYKLKDRLLRPARVIVSKKCQNSD
jgi:molecular chaperone GrpE